MLQKEFQDIPGFMLHVLACAGQGFKNAETLGDKKNCSDLRTNTSFQLAAGGVDGEILKYTHARKCHETSNIRCNYIVKYGGKNRNNLVGRLASLKCSSFVNCGSPARNPAHGGVSPNYCN